MIYDLSININIINIYFLFILKKNKQKNNILWRQNLAEEVAEEQDDEIEESFEDEVVNE